MHLRRLFVPLALVAFVLAAVACTTDGESAAPSVTSTATSPPPRTAEATTSPTPEATPELPTEVPVPRRSGDPALDTIIEAVESRDIEALDALVEYQEVGCTHVLGMGGPPKCAAGQDEGEVVRVFPYAACEGGWTNTGTQLVGSFAVDARGLWAVLAVEAYPGTDGWPVPDTLLVFHSTTASIDVASYLEVTDGRITRASIVCAGGLDDLVAIPAFELEVVAGPFSEPLPPPLEVPVTGIEGVDAVLEAVARYDVVALMGNMGRGEVPCVAQQNFPGDVECHAPKGEQPGDLVSVFPLAYCEGDLVRDPLPAIQGFLDQGPVLHSVLRAPQEPSPSGLYPHGDYWLVYEMVADELTEGARLHVSADGELLVAWWGCAPPLRELVTWEQEPLPRVPFEVVTVEE